MGCWAFFVIGDEEELGREQLGGRSLEDRAQEKVQWCCSQVQFGLKCGPSRSKRKLFRVSEEVRRCRGRRARAGAATRRFVSACCLKIKRSAATASTVYACHSGVVRKSVVEIKTMCMHVCKCICASVHPPGCTHERGKTVIRVYACPRKGFQM